MAREETNSRHHSHHPLRHICRESSAIRSSSLMAPSVPISSRFVVPRHQRKNQAGMRRHTEGLPHLDTVLLGLTVLQCLPPHSYSSGRLHADINPFPSRPHRPRGAPSNVSRLHILPRCSLLFHALARSHPHSGHHNRHRGTCPIDRPDIPLQLPADHLHPPGTLATSSLAVGWWMVVWKR
jgi:hypothetical protein